MTCLSLLAEEYVRAKPTRERAAGRSLSPSEELPDEVRDAVAHQGLVRLQQDQTRGPRGLCGTHTVDPLLRAFCACGERE